MIYLDNSATTKPCREAVDAINDALENTWGNPSSSHAVGNEAHRIMSDASRAVSSALGIKRPSDGKIIFTSGGTEANNLAVTGVIEAKNRPLINGRRGSIIITDSEHASVAETVRRFESEGFYVYRIPTKNGTLDLEQLEKNVPKDTVIASIMLVNNETGAIYDVKSAADIIKRHAPTAIIHSDCVQAFMKMKFTPRDIGADMVTVSAHKIFSAKGAGALYISNDIIKGKKLAPILHGGGQEDSFRSGTEAVPSIAGFAAATKKGAFELSDRITICRELSEYAIKKLLNTDGVRLNLPESRLANILSITVFNIKSETMLNFLSSKGICVSKSSACSSHSSNLSGALLSFGLTEEDTDSTLRLSFSHLNTREEIDALCNALCEGTQRLAKINKTAK